MAPIGLRVQNRHSLDIENRDDLGEMGRLMVRQKQGHDCVDVEFVDSKVDIRSVVWEHREEREHRRTPCPHEISLTHLNRLTSHSMSLPDGASMRYGPNLTKNPSIDLPNSVAASLGKSVRSVCLARSLNNASS